MSKAEDRYLDLFFQDGRLRNCSSKEAFMLGYHQAEKDNELTWEQIYSILFAEREVLREFGYEEHSNEEVCKEVLKRFLNERKEK